MIPSRSKGRAVVHRRALATSRRYPPGVRPVTRPTARVKEKAEISGTFGIADAYLFVVNTWAAMVDVDLSAFPNLLAFQARAQARPAVRAAMRAEGLAVAA